jgi:small conductance mechanosensitive channel
VVRNRMLRGIVQHLVASALVLAGIVIALDLLEATALVGAVLGAAGLAGIAMGLAFREIGENYLASILLGLRRPFSMNDHVVIGEQEGKVIRLNTRETILMSLEGNHVRLPNADVFKSVIVNYTTNPLRRLSFSAGIGTDQSLVEAQRIGVTALRDTPGVATEPAPFARVEELADSSITIQFFAWVDQRAADWYKVRSEGVRRVKVALERAGVVLPVPSFRIETEALRQKPPAEGEHEACEVGIDDVIDRQIRTQMLQSDEENLLESEDN